MSHCQLCGHRHFEPIEHELPDAKQCVHCGAIYWPGQRTDDIDPDYVSDLRAEDRENDAVANDHLAGQRIGLDRSMGGL